MKDIPIDRQADPVCEMRLFREVVPADLRAYITRFTERRLEGGDILLEPGRCNGHVYFVLSGQLQVHLDAPDKPAHAVIDPGDCVGEMSIIDGQPPSAFVVAAGSVRLLVLEQRDLWEMVDAVPGMARNLLHLFSRRVRHDNAVISDSFEAQRAYRNAAVIDPLTGLYNRRWLDEMFTREVRRCAAGGDPACLAMLDVDHFKRFNDTYGHAAGDHVLAAIAETMQKSLRPNDMIARYGGEEFAVLLPVTPLRESLMVSERLRQAVAGLDLGAANGHDLPPVTISVGVSPRGDADGLTDLMARADRALYRAKESGRNRVAHLEPGG